MVGPLSKVFEFEKGTTSQRFMFTENLDFQVLPFHQNIEVNQVVRPHLKLYLRFSHLTVFVVFPIYDLCSIIPMGMSMELGPGIPRRCQCGATTIALVSKTRENPGRKFFRCGVVFGENHVFKWADDAIIKDIEVINGKLAAMEEVMIGLKEELTDLKKDMSEIVALLDKLSSKIQK